MRRLDLQFLMLAALSLVLGVGMGIAMAVSHDFRLMPVHAHINLVGWASLALFGLAYRAYPRLGLTRLAKLHLLLAAPGAILLPAGIALAVLANSPALAIGASMLWLGACIIFLIQLVMLALEAKGREESVPAE